MQSPWTNYSANSPVTKIVKRAIDQFAFWSSQLQRLGMKFDEGDSIPYWNLLSAIYSLTEEEGQPLRATDAYAFAGGSPTTGKRKLGALIKQGLVVTKENPAKRTEKFVTVSDEAKRAIVATLDSWADNYEADTAAYKLHRFGPADAKGRRSK
jgi:DNA-binding MarR family transcriptional regulator